MERRKTDLGVAVVIFLAFADIRAWGRIFWGLLMARQHTGALLEPALLCAIILGREDQRHGWILSWLVGLDRVNS